MKTIVLLFVLAMLSAGPTRIKAQCVQSVVDVVELRGRIVSTYSAGQEPCAGATVELRSRSGRILQTIRTDDAGWFSFKPARPGHYVIRASFPNFISFYAPVRLEKSKVAAAGLIINLGVDATSECGGGWVKPEAAGAIVASPPN